MFEAMANQRAIAAELGLSQSAVSYALRGDPSIPEATRSIVIATAERLGYRPNAYVSSLMAHIRSGRPLRDKGCIALIFNRRSADESDLNDPTHTFCRQLKGAISRAENMGFYTEKFFLMAPGMTARRLDKIFFARNILGVVLMAPGIGADMTSFTWDRYASATIAFTWSTPEMIRVATDHRHHVDIAYEKLLDRGFKRIGFCLPNQASAESVNTAWLDRFLFWQRKHPSRLKDDAIFIGRPGETPLSNFRAWFRRNKPDALITLIGHEMEWLKQMKVRVPSDVSLVCLNRPVNSDLSGMEEPSEVIGETAADIVINQVLHNEHGLPYHPRLILIKGRWVDGQSVKA